MTKKIEFTINNCIYGNIKRLYGDDIISAKVNGKNNITVIVPYDNRFETLLRHELRNRRYKVL